MKQNTRKQFTENKGSQMKDFDKKGGQPKRKQNNGKKPVNGNKKSVMTTYSITVPDFEFETTINDLIYSVPEAALVFGQKFSGTPIVAAHCILETMTEQYKENTHWTCQVKTRSAQIITNNRVGFGWVVNKPKDDEIDSITVSVFIIGNNESLEATLAELGFVNLTK